MVPKVIWVGTQMRMARVPGAGAVCGRAHAAAGAAEAAGGGCTPSPGMYFAPGNEKREPPTAK